MLLVLVTYKCYEWESVQNRHDYGTRFDTASRMIYNYVENYGHKFDFKLTRNQPDDPIERP